MSHHNVGTQEEWRAARDELLAEEKELTRMGDELARKRRVRRRMCQKDPA